MCDTVQGIARPSARWLPGRAIGTNVRFAPIAVISRYSKIGYRLIRSDGLLHVLGGNMPHTNPPLRWVVW